MYFNEQNDYILLECDLSFGHMVGLKLIRIVLILGIKQLCLVLLLNPRMQ